jgi:hypothetical protein
VDLQKVEIGLPNSPAVDIVLIEVSIVPADRDVVRCGHDPCRADGVVCSDVRDDCDFARKADVGEQKLSKQRREGASNEPEPERVEQQLVAAVCVLLPASKFIVDSKLRGG